MSFMSCQAIHELTDEVNAKGEEIQAQREDLKALLQENIWKETNLTSLQSRLTMREARVKSLEEELALVQDDKSRSASLVGNLTAQLKEAEEVTWGLRREVEHLGGELETSRKKVDEAMEQITEKSSRVSELEQEVAGLREELRSAQEAAPPFGQQQDLGDGESLGLVPQGGNFTPPDSSKKRRRSWCWLGFF